LSPPMFYVELDVFSGRPNPRWPLTSEEAEELSARVSRLAPDGGAGKPSTALGYRAFIVYRTVGERPQRWLRVGHGVVGIAGNYRIRHSGDTEGIEELLKRQAVARGYGALIGNPAE
jgi:hypothetical protein